MRVVTIDAAGTQTAIAEQIVAGGADYVLALKGNQKGLAEDVTRLFEWAHSIDFAELQHDHCHTTTKGHGRVEIRDCWTIADPRYIGDLRQGRQWKSLRSVAQVQLERRIGNQVTVETRYYISSLSGDALQIQNAVRGHWEIENKVHWCLDVAFNEDACRTPRAKVTRPRTSPCCVIWRLICCARKRRPKSASKPNACAPAGVKIISTKSWRRETNKMQLP